MNEKSLALYVKWLDGARLSQEERNQLGAFLKERNALRETQATDSRSPDARERAKMRRELREVNRAVAALPKSVSPETASLRKELDVIKAQAARLTSASQAPRSTDAPAATSLQEAQARLDKALKQL